MIVYFAEPIDQDHADPREIALRNAACSLLYDMGVTVYRPSDAWAVTNFDHMTSEVVERINREALGHADLLVARLPLGTASVGVPMEIEHATRSLGIAAIVIGPEGVALRANPKVQVINDDLDGFTYAVRSLTYSRPVKQPLYHSGHLTPRSYAGDAGIDLVTSQDTTIKAGTHGFVPTGTRIEVPTGTFLWITSRSSTYRNFGLQVLPGIIDEGYTGELLASVVNTTDQDVTVKQGDRVCQVIVMPNETAKYQPVEVEAIRSGDRGNNGFGSTGAALESAKAV